VKKRPRTTKTGKAKRQRKVSGTGRLRRAKTTARAAGASPRKVRRFGQLVGLRPERLEEYKRYHAAVWPEILAALRKAEIRNYSIFHFDGKLFAYFEYHGPPAEFQERMRQIARALRMREWWDITDPMQVPVEGRAPGDWWADMEEVFHTD
jgi:L-rhamnose mutarotase